MFQIPVKIQTFMGHHVAAIVGGMVGKEGGRNDGWGNYPGNRGATIGAYSRITPVPVELPRLSP